MILTTVKSNCCCSIIFLRNIGQDGLDSVGSLVNVDSLTPTVVVNLWFDWWRPWSIKHQQKSCDKIIRKVTFQNVRYNNRIWFVFYCRIGVFIIVTWHVWNNCKGSQFFWNIRRLVWIELVVGNFSVCDYEENVHHSNSTSYIQHFKMNFELMTTSYKDLVRMVDPILFFFFLFLFAERTNEKRNPCVFLFGGRLCVVIEFF